MPTSQVVSNKPAVGTAAMSDNQMPLFTFANPPIRLESLADVHTLSQTKLGSVPMPSNLQSRLGLANQGRQIPDQTRA